MQFFIGIGLKWLTRIGLLIFYGFTFYYSTLGHNLLGWLASEHPWWTIFLVFATGMAFLQPLVFLFIPKNNGGEATLRKIYWLFTLVIIVLFLAVLYYAFKPFQEAVNVSVLAPLSTAAGGTLAMIYSSPLWKAYFAPTRFAYMWGILTACFVVFVALQFMWPRVKEYRVAYGTKPSVPSTSVSSGTFRATTPLGATVRPEAKTGPVPNPPPTETTEVTEGEQK